MAPFFYATAAVGIALEGLLVWRLFKHRLVSRYPYFSTLILYDFVRALFDVSLAQLNLPVFARIYWTTDILENALAFLIVWEALRSLFPARSALLRLAWESLLTIGAIALPIGVVLCWNQNLLAHPSDHYIASIFNQYASLAQGISLLAIAAIAGYYHIPFGRNLRGMILGSGLYLFLSSVTYAASLLIGGSFLYWGYLPALLYISITVVWLWAFWEYGPSPQPATANYKHARHRQQWRQLSMPAAIDRGRS